MIKTSVHAEGQRAGLFDLEQVERARRYHRPLYAALLADLALSLVLLAALAFTGVGDALYAPLEGLPWWVAAVVFPLLVFVLSTLVRLPLAFYRGYVHEKRWGFSTQTPGGWASDRAKALLVGSTLTTALLFGLVATARALPGAWPVVAAGGAAGFAAATSFLAPVVIEPLFNRFRPVPDEHLASALRVLAERAGVPVRDVLVADASRRTRKGNAYVSGFGRTRRVVLFDTLLETSDQRQVSLVVAHELGHRRDLHVLKSTGIVMLSLALFVLVVWALVPDPADPRSAPLILLLGALLQLLALPAMTALSRRWERAADRFSLELTHDVEAFERAQRQLATLNLSDLDPPKALYVLLFSHPTAPQRIAAARRWAAQVAA